MSIGKKLREELYEKRGLRLRFVAKKVGISHISLSNYVNDIRPIPEAKLRLICRVFDIDPGVFGLEEIPVYRQQEAL